MCKQLSAKAAVIGKVLKSIDVVKSGPAIDEALQSVWRSLQNAQQFVSDSRDISMLERIFKKNTYRKECEHLLFYLNLSKEGLDFALTCQIHNRIENNLVIEKVPVQTIRQDVEKCVHFASTVDFQSSIQQLKDEPELASYGKLTLQVADRIHDFSEMQNIERIVGDIEGSLESDANRLYETAEQTFKTGNLKQALRIYLSVATSHPQSHFRIGQIYDQPSKWLKEYCKRHSIPRDGRKAATHYYMAVRSGCDASIPFLGVLLAKGGPGLEKNT
ncbi:hypothetical protein EDD86DRAFT_219068 [Gorgonomyces haynaldii]|nr:hypothetical protein EDD86DRAFT_219068 [Gorgonomyces haynaldii]